MGKSSRHKAQNVHHFVPFSERISNVNIDVIHQIRRIDDETEGTLFGECITKWTELDLTDHFSNFRREIVGQVQTYEQLVHHKEEIILALKTHLNVQNSLALNALLDLLVQLAKDLQQDFVPHFYTFFEILVRLLSLHSQDAETLEQIFQALAYLFRVLWRFLIKDFKDVFSHFSRLLLSSQKDYIKVFAAESCAYLLRKVKKQNELLNFLFASLNESPELADGVGLLLFEMVKGVKFHFHTISEKVFPLILYKLGKWNPLENKLVRLPKNLVEQSVTIFMQECAEHTTKENCKELWRQLLDCIIQVHSASISQPSSEDVRNSKQSLSLVKHLCRLLRLVSVWLSHNSGKIVTDPEQVASTLCVLLKSPMNPEVIGSDLLGTVVNLLKSCQERLSVEAIFRLVTHVFKAPFLFSDFETFVKSLMDMPFFEKDVLPGCMARIHTELPMSDKKQEILAFVAELVIQKTQAPVTGDDLGLLTAYPLDQQWSRSVKENALVSYIDSMFSGALSKEHGLSHIDMPCLWAALVCVPHFSFSELIEKSVLLWKKIISQINTNTDRVLGETSFIVLNQLLRSFLICVQSNKLEALPVSCEEVYSVLRLYPENVSSVQIVDFYLSLEQNREFLTEERLEETYKLLEPNLVSSSHNMRLITCHILSMFPVQLPAYDDGITRECAFRTMLTAEKMPLPTVHNYREKLIYLRKLEYEMVMKCLPHGSFQKAPLLFLLGNQFWNFKLLWAPLADLIASHATGLDSMDFWDVMLEQLKRAASESEKELGFDNTSNVSEGESTLSLFDSYRNELLADARKADFTNFRVQLWRAMKKFPERCVHRSDELCELYLNFLKNEFRNADEDTRAYQSILVNQSTQDTGVSQLEETQMEQDAPELGVEEDDENIEEELDETSLSINIQTGPTDRNPGLKRRKAAIQSLLVHLDLFAMFKKQRSKFNQPEVQETFYELLKHRHSTIQKAAFECVVTYKSPHILPYRENFNRLLDDKTFKSEITLFRVDEESSEVKEIDREGFLPVLMRILYGKMHGKAGNETAGKGRSNIRRSIVFGFLSGCKSVELKYFLELLFQPCMHFVTDDPAQTVIETLKNVDLRKMIPLKKIKGILNTISIVSQKLGNRLEGFTHSLLQVLLGLAATLTAALEQRNMVLSGTVNLLKTLRHTVLTRLIEFFENFEDLDYSVKEIEAVFHAVVWPQSEKLVLEGVHHPTPLLKLFSFWSQCNRFLPLLTKTKDSGDLSSPLHAVFALLNAPAIDSSVATAILELVSYLLQSSEERDRGHQLPPLPEPYAYVPDTEERKLGEAILLPHIPMLLSYLQHSLRKMASGYLGKKQVAFLELKILARVSTFVTSPEECSILCNLLVPFFTKGSHLAQDIEENTLVSLTNMMQYLTKPESFYRTIAQLFSTIERRESRVLLCKLFRVICENNEKYKTVSSLVEKLNSWDRRKAEEPDYLARLEAFSQINSMISGADEPDVDILLPVVYNCCHFIYAIDDLSIRDNSTHCLLTIITKLASSTSQNASKAFNVVLEKTLVPQVKLGIRSKSEVVRHEFLAVLQSLVNNCPDHNMFTGLKDLCDKDPEADFFENIRHIQIHKRSRALRRLFKHLKDHQFRTEILMSYFNPLVHAFVLDSSYSSHANLQDAAIDLLGAICKQLPWQYYLQLLRFYLKLLPKKVELQKQIVRIIVALLDAFHYDLTNSTYRITFAPKVVENAYKEGDEDIKDSKTEEGSVVEPEAKKEETMDIDENEVADKDDDNIHPMELEIPSEELLKDQENEETTIDQAQKKDGKIVCSASAATKIHKTIVISLLPQLHKIVTQRAKSDDQHKLVKSKYPEDEEILRVPIALAMIKLLQNLPKGTLENRLPGILLKICNFLRCRSRDIRTTARDTLEKAALSLGARFFPFIVREMKSILTRGYQLHILSFTTHHLLKALAKIVNPGDLDPALASVQDVFYPELFGQVAEEKDVAAIKAKYFEAKFIKGYDAYGLMARCISPGCLNQLVQPIRGVLESTHSSRTANKAETLLRKVADGLMANKSIPLQIMMMFINSLTAKLLNETLAAKNSKVEKENEEKPQTRVPESCLLLPQAAPRGGLKPKADKKTNIHILIEFGLQLLNMCLRRPLLLPTELFHLQLLDPLVPAIRDCLGDSHVRTSSMAMRVLSWLLKFPLPSMKENISKIAQGMFVVLQNYAGAATSKGGNQELISMCFKAVTCLVRDVSYYQITTDQLQVLLTYCEEDLYNYSRQSTAFNLVRAILSRKLDVPQLHEVVSKLFEMSITASSPNVRLQSRQVILFYLMNYPLGKVMRSHLYFYIDHLEYEMEDGRESALEMMISMFTTFPKKILNNHCPKFFSALAMASYNDNSAKCRKLIALAIKTLIGKVDLKCRKTMFAEVIKWIKSENTSVKAMGCQVCGMFVEVEGGNFEFHLEEVVPLLQQQMDPSLYIESGLQDASEIEKKDICLLAVLNTAIKIIKELNIVRQRKFTTDLNLMWSHVLSHLLYPHLQVRLASSQLLGFMFSSWEPADIAQQQEVKENGENVIPYLLQDTPQVVKKFGLALCGQLKTPALDDAMATQAIKNLLYLARVMESLERPDDFIWLTKKIIREANMEVINNVKTTLKRNHTFKWVAAIGVSLRQDYVDLILPIVLPVLQREIADQAKDQELKTLAQEVVDLLKKQVGVEPFTAAFATSLKHRLEKRDVRKRQIAAEVVTNPDIAARKKIRHNLKKKETKKRKIADKKPVKRIKKNKLSILNLQVEDE